MKEHNFIDVKRPRLKADFPNALMETLMSAKKNDLVVYYKGTSGRCDGDTLHAASSIPGRLGALVQKALAPVSDDKREWAYCIQRA
jgi:hypothetical protein